VTKPTTISKATEDYCLLAYDAVCRLIASNHLSGKTYCLHPPEVSCLTDGSSCFFQNAGKALSDYTVNKYNNNNNNNNNSVVTNQGGKVTILWNQQVQTDRTIPVNKPDITIRGNENGTRILIDVAIPGDRNVIKKEAEKILKYKDLTREIQRMWNVKARVIPVVIGATGTISKSFRKYVSDIPGKQGVNEGQKTAILGTAHILRKVLT
jgi:hypothetical protein